jgi:hypothetical protein
MSTIIKMCTIPATKALCEFEVSRRPMTARKSGYVHVVEHPKKETKAINYNDTECARMEAERQPRRVARLKNLNINNK